MTNSFNESNEQYIIYIRLGESVPRLKDNIEKIIKIGQGDYKTVLTKHNTDTMASIWDMRHSYIHSLKEMRQNLSFQKFQTLWIFTNIIFSQQQIKIH